MVFMKKQIVKTVYELPNDFYVEVAEDFKDPEVIEFHMVHKNYGDKRFMFGVMKKDAENMIEKLIIGNVPDYIKIYKQEYFDPCDLDDDDFDCCVCCPIIKCECECNDDCDCNEECDCDCHDADDEHECHGTDCDCNEHTCHNCDCDENCDCNNNE